MPSVDHPPLQERVNSFVEWLFRAHRTSIPRGPKVINDAVHGNQYFAQHEVVVIDAPLIQRLKRIKQTGLVHHVFPSATHSRFEHCLGVVTLAEKCFEAVRDRFSVEYPRSAFPADPDRIKGDLAHLRMAALLHDVGHGLCSHASEQIYERLSDLREFQQDPAYARNAPGEVLSYLIVKAPTFQSWFRDRVVNECRADIDLDVVAQMILGRHPQPEKRFLAQIVSSPYDADKLDYIARDSYYCGLALTVDLPRFYSMISVDARMEAGEPPRLVLRNYVPLEQILFSKMMLFGSVYHHQKVKCLDSMLRALIQHVIENAGQCAFPAQDVAVAFAEPVEYLYVTDDDFFNQLNGFGDAYVKDMLRRFRQRDLFVRCVEVSRRTVRNWNNHSRKLLIELAVSPSKLDTLEKQIHQSLPGRIRAQCNVRDICVSVPGLPSLKAENAFIQSSPDAPREMIDRFFPLRQWVLAYAHNKWRSYVYAPRERSDDVRDAAISVLKDQLGVDVNVGTSNQACHL